MPGFDYHKASHLFKEGLYKYLGITLPKIRNQRDYWERRSDSYMDDFFKHGHFEREVFFQDMLVEELRHLDFDSIFEAGCGFGWNIRRIKEDLPDKRVGGLDFSLQQLTAKAKRYLAGHDIPVVNGDNCRMPLKDNAFDIGFSLGVFLNIHPSLIKSAAAEMIRVCGRYVIHMEWDAGRATEELRRKRAFKTNIISHDYANLYETLGQKVLKVVSYKDFSSDYSRFLKQVHKRDTWWQGYDGPDKYTLVVIELNKTS